MNEEILEKLRRNDESLTRLDLREGYIGDEGVAALADALKSNKTLTQISLSYNDIGAEGAVALADALKINKTLTQMDLHQNGIGDEGVVAVADALKINNTLTRIDLSYIDIGAEGASALADALKINKSITQISLSNNFIGDEGVAAFADALKINNTLTRIDLSYIDIGAEGASALADALKINKSITQIVLNNNNDIGDDGAAALADVLKINTTLTEIDLNGNGMGDEGAVALADALKINNTLTRINLSYNDIGPAGGAALADALKINTTLTQIDLYRNFIGDEGAAALADVLKINNTLTQLDLHTNDISAGGAAALADALKINNTLTDIDLSVNGIGDEGASALADALKINNTLTRIDLSYNGMGAEGAVALADALKINTTLTQIVLNNNHDIGDEGAAAFADALKINNTLTRIDLSNNGIGAEGAAALADAIMINKTLTEIAFDIDALDKDVLQRIQERLEANKAEAEKRRKEKATRTLTRSQRMYGDEAKGKDQLGLLAVARALARMLAYRDSVPPLVLGLLGCWGSGKSFLFHLIRQELIEIQKQDVSTDEKKHDCPYVGHLYLICFDVWTYAKGDLWSSIMFAILSGLNEQMQYEKQIENILNKNGKESKDSKRGTNRMMEGKFSLIEMMESVDMDKLEYLKDTSDEQKNELEAALNDLYKTGGSNISKVLLDAVADGWEKDQAALAKKKSRFEELCLKAHVQAKMNGWSKSCVKTQSAIVLHMMDTAMTNYLKKTKANNGEDDGNNGKIIDNHEEGNEETTNEQQDIVRTFVECISTMKECFPTIKKYFTKCRAPEHEGDEEDKGKDENSGDDDSNEKKNTTDKDENLNITDDARLLLEYIPPTEKYWSLLRAGKWSWPTILLVVATIVLPIVLFFLSTQLDGISNKIASVIGTISPFATAAAGFLSSIKDGLNTFDNAFEEAKAESQKDDQVLGDVESQSSENASEIAKLKGEIASLQDRVWLVEGEPLDKVVAERLESSGYEKELGTVHRAKQDFDRITKSMCNNTNEERFPRGEPRIVLFVDDLDRCPPDKVVETFEALQLLVKTKLFVVVLAIDARYVTLCLEKEYKGILHPTKEGHPTGLSYLEKIIQIPYRIPPISGQEAMLRYLRDQCPEDKADDTVEEDKADDTEDEEETVISKGKKSDPKERVQDKTEALREKEDKKPTAKEKPNLPGAESNSEKITEETDPAMSRQRFQQQQLSDAELGVFAEANDAFQVDPRAAKRVLNSFKIIKTVMHEQIKLGGYRDLEDEDLKNVYIVLLAMGANPHFRPSIQAALSKIESRDLCGCKTLGELIRRCLKNRVSCKLNTDCEDCLKKYADNFEFKGNKDRRFRLVRSFSLLGERDVIFELPEEETSAKEDPSLSLENMKLLLQSLSLQLAEQKLQLTEQLTEQKLQLTKQLTEKLTEQKLQLDEQKKALERIEKKSDEEHE